MQNSFISCSREKSCTCFRMLVQCIQSTYNGQLEEAVGVLGVVQSDKDGIRLWADNADSQSIRPLAARDGHWDSVAHQPGLGPPFQTCGFQTEKKHNFTKSLNFYCLKASVCGHNKNNDSGSVKMSKAVLLLRAKRAAAVPQHC